MENWGRNVRNQDGNAGSGGWNAVNQGGNVGNQDGNTRNQGGRAEIGVRMWAMGVGMQGNRVGMW